MKKIILIILFSPLFVLSQNGISFSLGYSTFDNYISSVSEGPEIFNTTKPYFFNRYIIPLSLSYNYNITKKINLDFGFEYQVNEPTNFFNTSKEPLKNRNLWKIPVQLIFSNNSNFYFSSGLYLKNQSNLISDNSLFYEETLNRFSNNFIGLSLGYGYRLKKFDSSKFSLFLQFDLNKNITNLSKPYSGGAYGGVSLSEVNPDGTVDYDYFRNELMLNLRLILKYSLLRK